MKRTICAFIFILVGFSTALAQSSGRVAGKVLNEKNEPVSGAAVTVKGSLRGAATTVDGSFLLVLPVGKYELSFTALGYITKQVSEVEVTANGVYDLNIVLTASEKQLEDVVVRTTSSARRETVNTAIAFQRNTNTVASVMSAESIRRSADRNTGEVLKRTPGASLQEGKFIVVRGLADRYNQAMLNGILLTSTEPDRKTFSFDVIPSAVIDNLVINKAFVPEYPGEWAGGLIQVNTTDIPSKNYFNLQLGTGVNTQSTGKTFYREGAGGKLDWLGIEDGTRALPAGYTTKTGFDTLSHIQKIAIGKQLRNSWAPEQLNALVNVSFQANGGFSTRLFGKKIGGMAAIIYSNNNRVIEQTNNSNEIDEITHVVTANYRLNDYRYVKEITLGGIGGLSVQLDPRNKVSLKSIININTTDAVTQRSGVDFTRDDEMKGNEFTFRQNSFVSTQLSGEHKIATPLVLKWYGAFNILDGYVPDQRRISYARPRGSTGVYRAMISSTLSQQSGSRIYQNLSDYIYTGGGDLNYSFNWLGQKQSVKAGYMMQVKDRLYDAKLFANYLPFDNDALRQLPADLIFAPQNFGDGEDNRFAFNAIKGSSFRYMANTILNAGFLQFDNQFTRQFRVVWGLRVEDYDQLVGSVKTWDPRHTHVVVRDYLPGLNATYKFNGKTNLRFSASQTVIRPELRELAFLNLYDFELNASVQGNPNLKRTKITNLDLRYELYRRSGELITLGVFYKEFKDAIEQLFTPGIGGSGTFSYQNADKARAYGAELEFRKKLDFFGFSKNFSFQANASYINSRVEDKAFNIHRSLQGQSPYLLNLGLLYDLPKHDFNATLLFNQVGHRIYLVGDKTAGSGVPDIYEAPRPLLDLQLAKKLLQKKLEIKLNITDIFNQTQYFYQNAGTKESFQKNTDPSRFTRKPGTTFNLTFNYAFKKS